MSSSKSGQDSRGVYASSARCEVRRQNVTAIFKYQAVHRDNPVDSRVYGER